jgi:hypothetical protein
MTSIAMRQKLYELIRQADSRQLRALCALLGEAETGQPWWKDTGTLAELDKREAELSSGVVQGMSWAEVKTKTRKAAQQRKKQ